MSRKLAESIPASLRRHSLKEQQPNKQIVEKKLTEQKLTEQKLTEQKLIEQKTDAPERVNSEKSIVNTEIHSMSAPIQDIDELLRCKEVSGLLDIKIFWVLIKTLVFLSLSSRVIHHCFYNSKC